MSLAQGENMINPDINLIDSILEVKASGIDATEDLNLPQGKSIAELLDDQTEELNKKTH